LDWCKKRALEYVEKNDLVGAWGSMLSDLEANKELRDHPAIKIGNMLVFSGKLDTQEGMKKFIEDFN
jgi:hypothetical protein